MRVAGLFLFFHPSSCNFFVSLKKKMFDLTCKARLPVLVESYFCKQKENHVRKVDELKFMLNFHGMKFELGLHFPVYAIHDDHF